MEGEGNSLENERAKGVGRERGNRKLKQSTLEREGERGRKRLEVKKRQRRDSTSTKISSDCGGDLKSLISEQVQEGKLAIDSDLNSRKLYLMGHKL